MVLVSPARIKLLPEHLIDQIKAGEVVERPASLLKELIENSIDAGATRIDIHLIQNGLELLAIEDNGQGMFKSELPYAFARHATSKIERFEDLYSLSSFGFRGEALASAASVSRLTCTTSPVGELEAGGKIILHGGQTIEEGPFKAREHGTSFFIRDLFFNTPARLKFMKSKTSEKNALKRIFYSALLSHPEVEFSIKWDEGDRKRYQKTTLLERTKEVLLGKKANANDLTCFQGEFDRTFVKGFIPLDASLGVRQQQYLFVNHRLFTDKALHQVILNIMAPHWHGANAPYAIFLEVAPNEIDVNVHPNKTQVKFFKTAQVIGVLKESLKNALPQAPKVESHPKSDVGPGLAYPQTSLKGHQRSQLQDEHSARSLAGQAHRVSPIAGNFFLVDERYLVDARLLRSELREHLLSHSEKDAIPLLIASALPLPKNWNSELEDYYRERAFDWEKLGSEKIALKTVPVDLGPYPPHLVASFLLRELDTHDKLPDDELDLLRLFLTEVKISELSTQCWRELDQQSIQKLFI